MTSRLIRTMAFLGVLGGLAASAHAQGGNTITIAFPGAPTGSCAFMMVALNNANGDYYDCLTGSWFKVNGAGGGSGTVTSVTFTGDGTVLSSTPSAAVTTSGTLTAALANAGAGTLLGNPTGASAAPVYTIAPVLGLAGSSVGQISFANATSGNVTLQPATGALGANIITVPAVTATLDTSTSALASNRIVLGAGGGATKTLTAFTTDGAAVMTVGVAAGGNGSLALAGNTSGTATFTAPAVAGTTTNPVASSNIITVPAGAVTTPSVALAGTDSGMWFSGSSLALVSAAQIFIAASGTTTNNIINSTFFSGANGGLTMSSNANPASAGADTGVTRLGAGIVAIGTGASANIAGLIQSGMTSRVASNFTTSGVGTALEAITGLTITVPATAANWTFHAHLAYSQAVGTAAVAFGIQAVTNAPTNCFATGEQFTAAGTVTTGTLATLTTTTATNIVSGTPGGTGVNNLVDIYGTCELGASANTIRLLVSTSTAADLVTVLRGSYFDFNP
jgi:hypothetical protein